MTLRFTLNYRAEFGQVLVVCGSAPELGAWDVTRAAAMTVVAGDDQWQLEIELPDRAPAQPLTYKYAIRDERNGLITWEWGTNRTLVPEPRPFRAIAILDFWRSKHEIDNVLFSAAFTKALMRRSPGAGGPTPVEGKKPSARKTAVQTRLRFQINAPRVPAEMQLAISGSDAALGSWDEARAVVLDGSAYPLWSTELTLTDTARQIQYKYGLYDPAQGRIVAWENSGNRTLDPLPAPVEGQPTLTVRSDEYFRHPGGLWRGAGVAIPVFALRSRQSTGVGEFTDLNLLVDWAVATGLKVVQVLPVNDTIATHTWQDSYPYAAVSVFALHPIYLNLQAMGKLKDKEAQKAVDQARVRLNALDVVDHEGAMQVKAHFIKLLYDQDRAKFLADPDFQAFFRESRHWLVPYAAFSALRDRFQTPDFSQWGPWATASDADLDRLTDPAQTEPNELGLTYDDFAVHYFQQYHLDKQLREATQYARSKGVALKGDLPIGIYRFSVEAWRQPELYHMHAQAGAPPDDFSVSGQNWRFPTYNWDKMAEDGYAWWRARMQQLARYFDVLRIDHILGFFRIWEIPEHSVQGLLGHFSPALPYHRDEIRRRVGWFDAKRMTEPYIRWHMLADIFNTQADAVVREFLDDYAYGQYSLKPHVRTQRQIEELMAARIQADPSRAAHWEWVRDGLYRLTNEVLFVPTANPDLFDPRITLELTHSYRELDGETRRRLHDLYIEYFYRRHEDFWREQGLIKLPAVKNATDMLICGEDLGMVPACVPEVMKETGILGLNIQRMPAQTGIEFFHPTDAPYLSVVSPSSHDMSTVRGWWEEDRQRTQRFYNTILGHTGDAPYYCEPWIARDIVVQHLYSPAMWAIFPIQDLLAIDGRLRREDPHAEQINVPANPTHYWRYRLHIPLEDLIGADDFNRNLRKLVREAGRETGS